MFRPEQYLVSLCSAIAIASFLYFKSAILLKRPQRAVLALVVGLAGTLLMPAYLIFAPAITITWIAIAILGCVLIGLIWRLRSLARQAWTALDIFSAGSILAAAIYSLSEITLGANDESPSLTLLAALLTLAACIHILRELERASVLQRPSGLVFAQTLLIAGAIPCFFGLHRIGVLTWLCIFAGIVILILRLKSFFRTTEERRIVERMSAIGDILQPEYTEPSEECPEPRLWSMYDPMTAEKEVLDLLYAVVRALKPRLVVETGTFSGVSSTYIARAMKENGRGRLITCETDPVVYENACGRFRAEGLSSIIDCRLGSSLQLQIDDEIDLLYSDSDLKVREDEVRRFIRNVNPFGLILMHDAGSRFKIVRDAALKMESEGLISVVLLSTPRGLVVAQKHQGRK